MNKQEQIEAKRIKPIEVGDTVRITVPYKVKTTTKVKVGRKNTFVDELVDKIFRIEGPVIKIDGDEIHVQLNSSSVPSEIDEEIHEYYPERYTKVGKTHRKYVSPTFHECGANSFGKYKRRIDFYNQDISSLLSKAGYRGRGENFEKADENKISINFDPFVLDANGQRQHFQRGLVWTLEQKQLLIESIYQGIEIGKFLFRFNSWQRREKEREESGRGHDFDCIDGKQRFFAILDFLQNKYPDSHGNYWKDLSSNAHGRFTNYGNLSYGQMPEDATDEEVIDNFLTLNFTGTPMSPEHIEYVRSINVK